MKVHLLCEYMQHVPGVHHSLLRNLGVPHASLQVGATYAWGCGCVSLYPLTIYIFYTYFSIDCVN
jgi:hypothetical protein